MNVNYEAIRFTSQVALALVNFFAAVVMSRMAYRTEGRFTFRIPFYGAVSLYFFFLGAHFTAHAFYWGSKTPPFDLSSPYLIIPLVLATISGVYFVIRWIVYDEKVEPPPPGDSHDHDG